MKRTNHLIYFIIALVTLFSHSINAATINKRITFEVTVPTGTDVSKIQASIPALKYNKKVVFSWTTDDSYSIYNAIYSVINKKWVDNEKMSFWIPGDTRDTFFHLNGERSKGYVPNKTLDYTDGCGIHHRFASSIAYWPDKLTDTSIDVGKEWPTASTKELILSSDFGSSVCFHDIGDFNGNINSNTNTQENYDQCLKNAILLFNQKLGIKPKIMIEPNGDHAYVEKGISNTSILATIGQNDGRKAFPANIINTLNKSKGLIERNFNTSQEDLINQIKSNLALPEEKRIWIINGSHKEGTEYVSLFLKNCEELFGASGEDCIWFPSLDECLEYWFMKEKTTISKEIEGNIIRFTLDIPIEDNFYFQSLSLLVDGISSKEGIIVKSDNATYGTSYGINDNKLLVNLDFNESLPQKTEKYTAIFEKEKTTETYEDAMYFISQLKPELKEPYIKRVDALLTPPVLSELSINSGAQKVKNNCVTVSFRASENTAYYRISESADFTNIDWSPLSNNILFHLTPESGNKTVYVQLKNAVNTSEIKSINIELEQSDKKIVIGLNGYGQNNQKEIHNEDMLNNVDVCLHEGWKPIQLYDTSNYPLTKLAKDINSLKTYMSKYSIDEREDRTYANHNPKLTNNSGVYPDRFIQTSHYYGCDQNVTPGSHRFLVGLIDVPNGCYEVKILGATNEPQDEYKYCRYQANNSKIVTPNSDIFYNNNSNFIEIKNVNVEDGVLIISSWRDPSGPSYGCYAPMNLIEIKPAEKNNTGINENIKDSSITVYSGKGKLTIDNCNSKTIMVYRVDGTIVQQIMPKEQHLEINLPAGVYIVNGKKGIVY